MRILEYRQGLFGRGYTVTSGTRHYEEMHGVECPPIRMYQLGIHGEKSNRFEDLVENLRFNYDLEKGTAEEYREKYTSILLGKIPDWNIIAFQVTVGEVYIDLYNRKTKETDFYSLETGECGLELRFEVPRTDGGPCAVYDVRIEGVNTPTETVRTTVTEYINHVRREIEFFHKTLGIDAVHKDDIYIEVTEYADL